MGVNLAFLNLFLKTIHFGTKGTAEPTDLADPWQSSLSSQLDRRFRRRCQAFSASCGTAFLHTGHACEPRDEIHGQAALAVLEPTSTEPGHQQIGRKSTKTLTCWHRQVAVFQSLASTLSLRSTTSFFWSWSYESYKNTTQGGQGPGFGRRVLIFMTI